MEAKEAEKRSAAQLLLPHTVDAAVGSTYKRQKKSSVERLRRTPAHTAVRGVMEGILLFVSSRESVQHMEQPVATVIRITTLSVSAGENLGLRWTKLVSMRVPYLML